LVVIDPLHVSSSNTHEEEEMIQHKIPLLYAVFKAKIHVSSYRNMQA